MGAARDFTETKRTPGWENYEAKVQEQVDRLEKDLASIDPTGKTADQIGVEHISITSQVAGLKRALGIGDDILNEPEDD